MGAFVDLPGIRFEANSIVIVGALTQPFRKTTGQFAMVLHDERLARECKLIRWFNHRMTEFSVT